jgi:AcrR family transcriptional regulator
MNKPLTPEEQTGSPSPVRPARPQNPPVSRRERRKLATREALIKAAQEVLAVQGVYLAAIEEITERADVAKGSFYQYFRNRDELLDVLLTRRLEELQTRLQATPPTGTFAASVRTLIQLHLDYFLQHEDFLLFLHQIRGLITMNRDDTPSVREAYRRYLVFLAEWLHANGVLTPAAGPTPEEGVCTLLGLLTGFLSHYALLAPLATLRPQSRRLEAALTTACLAFWQSSA